MLFSFFTDCPFLEHMFALSAKNDIKFHKTNCSFRNKWFLKDLGVNQRNFKSVDYAVLSYLTSAIHC